MGMGLRELFWLGGKAFLIAFVLTPILRDVFRSYDIVDRPGARKVHAHPIPRIGGIPIAIAFAFAMLSLPGETDPLAAVGWPLLAGGGLVFLTGLVDDFFDLRPVTKLMGQVAAAAVVYFGGTRVEALLGYHLPDWLSALVTLFWLLLCTNALNLIDGLDGLCAGMGLMATLTMFGAALLYGNTALAIVTIPLAGALAGFLLFDFNPATVFLGDSGALLIGFLLGCFGMIWTQKAATILGLALPLVAMSVPLLDVLLSVVRRFLRRKPIFSADRGHIHHRLLDRGLSPAKAVFVLYVFTALGAAFALLAAVPNMARMRNVVLLSFCLVVLLFVQELRYMEFRLAGKMLLQGDFQRSLDSALREEQLVSALAATQSELEWWAALVASAKEQGWWRITWIAPHAVRDEKLAAANGPAWSFSVPLSENQTLEIEGRATSMVEPGTSANPVVIAGILLHSFAEKRESWRQPSIP